MLQIIAATDFSEVAENAVNYACMLASVQKAQVLLIHSFIIPVMFSDIPMPGSLVTDAQNDAEQQMTKLAGNISQSYPGLDIKSRVIFGDTVDALDESITDGGYPWLIVVGNSGTGEKSDWPGGNLMSVLKKMEPPVLAVPPQYTFRTIRRICFAFDNKHKGNDKALSMIKEITQQINAELHVLTIQPHHPDEETISGIDADVQKKLSDVKPVYHAVYDTEDIDAAIMNFTEKNNIDWLIMIPRKHSFFEGLFHKSHIKAIAHRSLVPILALHEGEI